MSKSQDRQRQRKPTETPGKLYVSFWDICLDNLPEGAFVRRRITAEAARRLIDGARREERLVGVSKEDVLAPYRARERENHDTLRRALKKNFGIVLTFRDFTGSSKSPEGTMYSITPLDCARVAGGSQLMVVTCAYTLVKTRQKKELVFKITPGTIEFCLIEAAGGQ